MGYGEDNVPKYVLNANLNRETYVHCMELLRRADVVIAGSAPQKMLQPRIREGKLLFRYSERPLKNGPEWGKYLPRMMRWHLWNPPGKPIYMLCASAYTLGDYSRFGLFRNRAYRWGYFTETKQYSVDALFAKKSSRSFLWVGRLLPWKHPEHVVEAVRRLRDEGYEFDVTIIGMGELESQLKHMISQYDLENRIRLMGAMKPQQVRRFMEEAGIFLFTSDRQEGWGAVLNESMNSGCAVIASHAIGSAPFLIKDGVNGLLYESNNVDMLYQQMKYLLEQPAKQEQLGRAAYGTITEEWNAEMAAMRLLQLAERILAGEKTPNIFPSGPCSKAEIIQEGWFPG